MIGSPNREITASLMISMAGSATAITEQILAHLCCSAWIMYCTSGEVVKVAIEGNGCDSGKATVTGLVRLSYAVEETQYPGWQV